MVIYELLGHVKVLSDRGDASVEKTASFCPIAMPGDKGPNAGTVPRDRGGKPPNQGR